MYYGAGYGMEIMRTLKRGRRRSLGLSMVELMLALAIMIIALFAIMTMILHATRSKESQRELSIAKEAVHQRLDELRSQTWTQLSQVAPPSTAYSATTGKFTLPIIVPAGESWARGTSTDSLGNRARSKINR